MKKTKNSFKNSRFFTVENKTKQNRNVKLFNVSLIRLARLVNIINTVGHTHTHIFFHRLKNEKQNKISFHSIHYYHHHHNHRLSSLVVIVVTDIYIYNILCFQLNNDCDKKKQKRNEQKMKNSESEM